MAINEEAWDEEADSRQHTGLNLLCTLNRPVDLGMFFKWTKEDLILWSR